MKIETVENKDTDTKIHIIDFDGKIEIKGQRYSGIILLGELPVFLKDIEPIKIETIIFSIELDEAIKNGRLFGRL